MQATGHQFWLVSIDGLVQNNSATFYSLYWACYYLSMLGFKLNHVSGYWCRMKQYIYIKYQVDITIACILMEIIRYSIDSSAGINVTWNSIAMTRISHSLFCVNYEIYVNHILLVNACIYVIISVSSVPPPMHLGVSKTSQNDAHASWLIIVLSPVDFTHILASHHPLHWHSGNHTMLQC